MSAIAGAILVFAVLAAVLRICGIEPAEDLSITIACNGYDESDDWRHLLRK